MRTTIVSLLVLCASSASRERTATAGEKTPLEGPPWRLVALGERNESALAAAGRAVTARFARGQVSGSSGCNTYGGSYAIDGEGITLGPLAGTLMACPA